MPTKFYGLVGFLFLRGFMNETSATIAELAKALCKAQGEMKNAPKDAVNPFFKSHYADLASCWDALRPVLSKHGLSVTQYTLAKAEGTELVTLLLHTSGEWVRGTYPINPKDPSPQALGSALTFGKRYALQAITGLASEDDDGNAAQEQYRQPHAKQSNAPLIEARTSVEGVQSKSSTHPSEAQLKRLFAISKKSNWSEADIKSYIAQLGITTTKDLSFIQYEDLCSKMQKYPKEVHVQ